LLLWDILNIYIPLYRIKKLLSLRRAATEAKLMRAKPHGSLKLQVSLYAPSV
jgi:hypothetical protein